MRGNPTLYKAVLVHHPFKIFSFSQPSTRSKKPIKKNSLACVEPIKSSDGHESCVFCLGRAHTEAALGGSDCPHCGDMSLRTLRLRVAIVQGDELAQLTLPRSSSAASFEPRRKVPWVSDADLLGSGDEPAPAQCPRAPHPPAAGPLPVRFMTTDLRPSPNVEDVVSFGAMEGTEEEDDAFRWQRLRERSGLTARWITLRPTAATRGTSITASCPRQWMSSVWSGRLLPSRPEAVWTSGTSSRIAAEKTPRGDQAPFSPRCTTR